MVVFFFIKLQTCAADLSNIQLEDLSKPKLCSVCVCVSLSLSEFAGELQVVAAWIFKLAA
jgi:hypothetical protein